MQRNRFPENTLTREGSEGRKRFATPPPLIATEKGVCIPVNLFFPH